MDEESLQQNERRRGSCLDVFLVASILFLLVTVTAGAAGGVIVVMQLQSKLHSESPSYMMDTSKTARDPPHEYKVQKFVYLEAIRSELKSSNMQWAPVNYSDQTSVGSIFLFDEKNHSLKATHAGTYFIYINLNLTCTHQCTAGLLSLRVGDKLTCEVQLPQPVDTFTPVTRKCWTVSQLSNESVLVTQMTVPKEGLKNWKLELSGSGFGMFQVD
ncbi:uncharacterized protein ACO6RY_19453 [Pungitius sinensis]